MKRKIIQVISKDRFGYTVLCDDGTIWTIDGVDGWTFGKYTWKQTNLPKIPNTESNYN